MKRKALTILNIFFIFLTVNSYGWNTPTPSSPSNGASVWTGLTLNWNAIASSQFYQVQVDTNPNFNSTALISVTNAYINSSSSNSDTEHYLENLYFGKTYYWRVRAYITGDTSAWSTALTFNTKDYVTLSSPTTGSSSWTGLTLDWSAHAGIDFYDLEVDTTNSFNSTVLFTGSKAYINSSSVNSDTEDYLENLYFGKTYYWRVRARNTVDTSAWSTVFTFNTKDYVTLSSPTNQQINVNIAGTTLDWSVHTGIDTYQLELDTVNSFNSSFLISVDKTYINSSNGNSDTQYGTGALLTNQIYYWRVRAINAVDTCLWTSRVFSTGTCVPPSAPTTISGTATVCSGSSNIFSIATVSGATSYTWTLPSGWSGTSTTTSITTIASTTSGTISVVANNVCGLSISQTLTITTGGSTPPTPGSISGTATVCSGTSNTYSIAAVSGATSYTWVLPSGWTGSSTTTSITTVASTTSGNVSVIANNSCGPSVAQTLNITIGGSAPSTPGSISGSATACSGTSNIYSITAVSGATSYTWTLPNGWVGTSISTSITASANAISGNITVVANNICGSSSAQTKSITVPTIDTTVSQLGGTLTSNASGVSFQWINCNGNTLISGQTNQSYNPTSNGTYAVIITKSGCSDTSSCYSVFSTMLATNAYLLPQIKIYPKPSTGKFIIENVDLRFKNYDLKIYNVLGEKLYSAGFNSKIQHEIDLSNAPKGIYFIELQSEGNKFNDKIIIQ
ncbi:MAG: T9SS type A sorting domain-containing protein [Bacteroidetes bacterium]|nr:T9SS type A sorting domain-containing protein [Bacteroidota bacterium]